MQICIASQMWQQAMQQVPWRSPQDLWLMMHDRLQPSLFPCRATYMPFIRRLALLITMLPKHQLFVHGIVWLHCNADDRMLSTFLMDHC